MLKIHINRILIKVGCKEIFVSILINSYFIRRKNLRNFIKYIIIPIIVVAFTEIKIICRQKTKSERGNKLNVIRYKL